MTEFLPGDRVYNVRPCFGPLMPIEDRERKRKGTVLHIMSNDWPWIRWDDGYEYSARPTTDKLRLLTAIDELAALVSPDD